MFKAPLRFLLLVLALQFGSNPLFANEDQKLRELLGKEIESSQKEYKIQRDLLPNPRSQDWKVHLVAEEDAFSEVVEIQGNSILFVGNSLVADRIIIHGDGVVWVKGKIQCPVIDIRGKGLVMFDTNSVGYNEGWIKLNEGVILSKESNAMNVHFRRGGFLRVGAENHGEVLTSLGDLAAEIHGDQHGDINFLSQNGKASLKIRGDLRGSFSSRGPIDLEIGGDIYKNLMGEADIKLKAGKFLGDQLSASGHLEAEIHQLGERSEPTNVSARSAKLNIAKGRFGDISLVGNGELKIGGASLGRISSLQGSLAIQVGTQHEGSLSAGASIKLEAQDSKGDLVAGQNLSAKIKGTLISHRLACGRDARVSCSLFEGNTDIKGRGEIVAEQTRRKSFSSLISLGTGKVTIKGLHQLDTLSRGALELKAGSGTGYVKVGSAAKISFDGDHRGLIQVKGPMELAVGGAQLGSVHGSSKGQVKIKTLASGLTILGEAKVDIGNLQVVEYEDTILELGSGSLNLQSDAIFDIVGLSSGKWLKVSINGARKCISKSKGSMEISSSGPSVGEIQVSEQLVLTALNHEGPVKATGTFNINITKDWYGNLESLSKTGTSSIKAATIRDSNLLIASNLSLNSGKILNREPGEEQIRIGAGTILVKEQVEANLFAVGKVTVKARRIIGDVFVDDASKVDAIVRGRLRTGMN